MVYNKNGLTDGDSDRSGLVGGVRTGVASFNFLKQLPVGKLLR